MHIMNDIDQSYNYYLNVINIPLEVKYDIFKIEKLATSTGYLSFSNPRIIGQIIATLCNTNMCARGSEQLF